MRHRFLLPAALLTGAIALLVLLLPTPASAAGGPLIATASTRPDIGIPSRDGRFRYVAFCCQGGTTVAQIRQGLGTVRESNTLVVNGHNDGPQYGFPQVAADGSTSGLSADGSTLVMIRAYGPSDRAELLVLETDRLTVSKRIELNGQFSFDAISPDGGTAFVVVYPQPLRYDRYEIRGLDLATGRLARKPVADVDVGAAADGEEEGPMRGLALSTASSADGRWAYTLYDGGGDVPFVHALDTVGEEAVCIFLPSLVAARPRDLAGLRMEVDDAASRISIVDGSGADRLLVDTESFAVTPPPEPGDAAGTGGVGTVLVGAAAICAWVAATLWFLRRRRSARTRPGPEAPSAP